MPETHTHTQRPGARLLLKTRRREKGAVEALEAAEEGVPREKESTRKRERVRLGLDGGGVLTWGTAGARPSLAGLLPPHSQHCVRRAVGGEAAQAASVGWEWLKPAGGSQPETATQCCFIRSFQGRAGAGGGEQRAGEGGSLCGAPAWRPHLPRCAL